MRRNALYFRQTHTEAKSHPLCKAILGKAVLQQSVDSHYPLGMSLGKIFPTVVSSHEMLLVLPDKKVS